jgi:hypothetical protein
VVRGRALARERKLKVSNPFQLKVSNPFPAPGSLVVNPQQTRRERFKKVFFAVLAMLVILMLTLLIQGCRSTQQMSSQAPDSVTVASQN